MNPRHLAAIKASELRHRYFNELGSHEAGVSLWVLAAVRQGKRE